MIHEKQQEQEQKDQFTYIFCSIMNNSIFLLLLLFLLWFLLLLCNFVDATTKLHIRNAGDVLYQIILTFTVRCKVTLTCTVRHTQVRCTSHYRHLVAKSSTTSGQLDMSA